MSSGITHRDVAGRWPELLALVGRPGVRRMVGNPRVSLFAMQASAIPWRESVLVHNRELYMGASLPVVLATPPPYALSAVHAPDWALPWLGDFPEHAASLPDLDDLAALRALGFEGRKALGEAFRVGRGAYWSAYAAATGRPIRNARRGALLDYIPPGIV